MASVRVSGVTQVRSRYDHSLHETLAYPAEGFEAFGEIVRGDEVLQVCAELLVIVVVVSLHGGFFDGPIHAFDLPVGPGMIGFGEAVIDAVQKTDSVKRVTAEARRGSLAVLGRVGELDAVIGEHYVNSIRDGCDQSLEKRRGRSHVGTLDQFHESELRGPIDGHE